MDVRIYPSKLSGKVQLPESKSQLHRLLIAAALADGVSRIDHITISRDIEATLSCLHSLGAEYKLTANGGMEIRGIGSKSVGTPVFNCGESASTLRFMLPISLVKGRGGVFIGDGRLLERPMSPYLDIFREKGIEFELNSNCLTVHGKLESGDYHLRGDISSQFFTGLFFALPLTSKEGLGYSTVRADTQIQSRGYLDMTIAVLQSAGVKIEEYAADQFRIEKQIYHPVSDSAETDWSAAAFWYTVKMLGSNLDICGLSADSRQADRIIVDYSKQLSQKGYQELDISQCPDIFPPLAILAALRKGTTKITGASRLRLKESDRLSAAAEIFLQMGVKIDEFPDSIVFHGAERLSGGCYLDSRGDHRIAMMAAIAASYADSPVTISGGESVSKSYPDFWNTFRSLGGRADVADSR